MLVALFLMPGTTKAEGQKLLILGDSLTAGYGLNAEHSFPSRLQDRLRLEGYATRVVNGGVSGDTTAGGVARLDWMLADKPRFVLIELGANDGLRGLDPEQSFANLDKIIARLKAQGLRVLLTGMRAPPNLGRDYVRAFDGIYERLAAKHDVPLYPFFLEGVVADPALNQRDGIHPNARGVGIIVEKMWPWIKALIELKD